MRIIPININLFECFKLIPDCTNVIINCCIGTRLLTKKLRRYMMKIVPDYREKEECAILSHSTYPKVI